MLAIVKRNDQEFADWVSMSTELGFLTAVGNYQDAPIRLEAYQAEFLATPARYRCVVAYLETPLAKPQLVEATCEGRVLTAPRGSGGFGYDPLFFSTDLEMTFAEAALPAKQRVSHRGRAIRALMEVLLRRSR